MGERADGGQQQHAEPTTERVRPAPDVTAVRRRLSVGAADDPAERDADRMADAAIALLRRADPDASGARVRRSPAATMSPDPRPVSRVRSASPVPIRRAANPRVIRRAFVNGSAEKDVPLFKKEDPKSGDDSLTPIAAKAGKLGVTALNMAHYLERHTFKYQRLSGKTTKQRAGMFPTGTTAAQVKSMLVEAVNSLPDDASIGEAVTSKTVDLKNGLKVNLGALKGGKLSAFFPIGGTGYHYYDNGELNAIRLAKNAPAPATDSGATTDADGGSTSDADGGSS